MYLDLSRNGPIPPGGFEGLQQMVLVSKSYLDVAGHPSWGWRARHGSEMIQQILSIDAAALPAPAGLLAGCRDESRPAVSASPGSAVCASELHRDAFTSEIAGPIRLIGARPPRFFSRQFAVC